MRSCTRLSVLPAMLVAAAFGIARADGTVEGHARFEKLKGRPAAGYAELYEWNAFLSAEGEAGSSQSYRCGFEAGGGSFSFAAAAGNHNIYVSQPVFFARSKLVTGVHVDEGQAITKNPELSLDYSCYFLDDWTPWRNVWYQTFVATGTSVNRISWRTAGSNATSLSASVVRDNGGNITTWPQVGPSKSAGVGWGDHYVGFRSGQIPTTPGQRYAIRLTGEGAAPHDFAPFARQEDGNGYTDGQAYDEWGDPADYDLNICVFSDNDGTVIPYCATRADLSELTEWCGACGQTFKATGTGVAACDLFFASTEWALDVRCTVRANGPGGPQVGRTKIGHGAWNAGGTGVLGVSWAAGEVPLTPGQTYYIEMAVVGGATGWNPYRFDPGADAYADGQAYISGGARDFDLDMTIMEYSPMPQPTINRSPATLSASTRQGSSPANQTFTIANSGSGTLSYTISDDATWLSVDPAGGTATTETDTITVSYSTANLPTGQHSATITISDPNATNNPQAITVTLTLDAATSAGFYKVGWNLTSVPVEPTNPEAGAVFQDLIALGNTITNNLYRYETGVGYAIYPASFTGLTRGRGYWLYLTNAQPSTVMSVVGQVATSEVSISLPQGWSIIGHPFAQPTLLANCQVGNGITTQPWTSAVAAGRCQTRSTTGTKTAGTWRPTTTAMAATPACGPGEGIGSGLAPPACPSWCLRPAESRHGAIGEFSRTRP